MLTEALKDNVVKLTFTKKNGDLRVMVCTLIPDMLPQVSGSPAFNPEVTTVYDLENQGWRSFRNDSVIDYETVELGTT